MNNRQLILIHKALETSNSLTRHDADRIALALDLLDESHWRVVADLENAAGHTVWAAENLAKVEAAAPRTTNDFGWDAPAETPEVIEAREHVARYEQEWWTVKARIDAIAEELERSIDLAAYAAHDEAQVPS